MFQREKEKWHKREQHSQQQHPYGVTNYLDGDVLMPNYHCLLQVGQAPVGTGLKQQELE